MVYQDAQIFLSKHSIVNLGCKNLNKHTANRKVNKHATNSTSNVFVLKIYETFINTHFIVNRIKQRVINRVV